MSKIASLILIIVLISLIACTGSGDINFNNKPLKQQGPTPIGVVEDNSLRNAPFTSNYEGYLRIKLDLLHESNASLQILNPNGSIFGVFDGNLIEPHFEADNTFLIKEYYPEYYIAIFEANGLDEEGKYPVRVNSDIKYIPHIEDVTIYENIEQHVKNSFIEISPDNPLRQLPDGKAVLVNESLNYSDLFFDVEQIKGNWALVKCNATCEGCPENDKTLSGWVEYVKNGKISVNLFYVC